MLAGLAASALTSLEGHAASPSAPSSFLEIQKWRLHETHEAQATRVADYLNGGLAPALSRAGARMVGAFANLIGEDGPYYVSITQYTSLSLFEEVHGKLGADDEYQKAAQKLAAGQGLPFVRLESSLLRSFNGFPQALLSNESDSHPPRVFEWRTYESQSITSLARKVTMFNGGEIAIFERLGMRPVFFGETIIGPKQPNLMYMLSFDNLDQREKLWRDFAGDPGWKSLSSPPQLSNAEIVVNISNVMLRPLAFSLMR